MASNIDYISVDSTFPVAGKDNDSQGFRDNFSVIRNNFESAKGEIEDLQLYTARLDILNDFGNNTIRNVNLTRYTNGFYNGGLVSSTTSVEVNNGPYQLFIVNNDVQFIISGFPNVDHVSKITVQVAGDGTQRNIAFQVDGASTLKKSSRWPGTTTLPITGLDNPFIFEFWTYDKGVTVFCDYLGQFT